MIREEIKKYVMYSQILRKKIKDSESPRMKKVLYKELAETYSRLEFLRGLLYAEYKIIYGNKKGEDYAKFK